MNYKDAVVQIAGQLSIDIPKSWAGVGPVWPLLECMRTEGAVVVVKLDGERCAPDDNGQYTVLVSGSPLLGEHIRTDAETIEAALSYIIVEYARRVWTICPTD